MITKSYRNVNQSWMTKTQIQFIWLTKTEVVSNKCCTL